MKNKRISMPKKQLSEVLWLLLTKKYVTPADFTKNYIMGYRARISELRKEVNINRDIVEITNKFGRTVQLSKYSLNNKELAEKLYRKINI